MMVTAARGRQQPGPSAEPAGWGACPAGRSCSMSRRQLLTPQSPHCPRRQVGVQQLPACPASPVCPVLQRSRGWWCWGRPEPPHLPTAPGGFLAVALCDFPSGAGAAAVLRMGEQLRVLSEDGDWWLVASEVSGRECHIPSSCVAKVRHRWLYEGVSRQKAEELLLRPGNRSGSFLIRESQTRRGCYSLSVRRSERAAWDAVTHYRIHRLDNGWLYIAPRLTFPGLHDLVDHYSEFGEGLCCSLREPCSTQGPRVAPVPAMPAVVKKPSLNWDQIDSSLLFSEAASPPDEDSPISLGLREAISSYLLLTETDTPKQGPGGTPAKSS